MYLEGKTNKKILIDILLSFQPIFKSALAQIGINSFACIHFKDVIKSVLMFIPTHQTMN